MIHHPTHWVGVAIVASLALLAFEAAGQGTGAQAVFEGRPAMSGAQAGQGAMAGPAQGGIGLQGSAGAERKLQTPAIAAQTRLAGSAACEGPTVAAADKAACLPQAGDERRERRQEILGIEAPPAR